MLRGQEFGCFSCAYDLRATPVDAVCPECGTHVADSARRWHNAATLGDPVPVRRISVLMLIAFVVLMASPFVTMLFAAVLGRASLIILAAGVLTVILLVLKTVQVAAASEELEKAALRPLIGTFLGAVLCLVLAIIGMAALFNSRGGFNQGFMVFMTLASTGAWTLTLVHLGLQAGLIRRRMLLWPDVRWLPRAWRWVQLSLWTAAGSAVAIVSIFYLYEGGRHLADSRLAGLVVAIFYLLAQLSTALGGLGSLVLHALTVRAAKRVWARFPARADISHFISRTVIDPPA